MLIPQTCEYTRAKFVGLLKKRNGGPGDALAITTRPSQEYLARVVNKDL